MVGTTVKTVDDLENAIQLEEQRLKSIRGDRGRRYGKPDDTLANVKKADPEHAWRGAYIASVECLNRIENYFFIRTNDMTEEQWKDFFNACDDLQNYAHYIPILAKDAK